MRILLDFLCLCVVSFFLSLTLWASNENKEFDFSQFIAFDDIPDSYSLYFADLDLSPVIQHNEEYKNYLNQDLFNDGEQEGEQEKKVLFIDEDKSSPREDDETAYVKKIYHKSVEENVEEKSGKKFYVVRLYSRKKNMSEDFLKRLCGKEVSNTSFTYSGGCIIFPQSSKHAMIYSFGTAWKSLINPYVIVPRWGLRVVSSIFNPQHVREISARYYRSAVPSTHKERSEKTAPLKSFGIEVGSEGLEKLRVKPRRAYNTQKIFEGGDSLVFGLTAKKSSESKNLSSPEMNLKNIAKHFYDLSTGEGFEIHKSLRHFVDQEVTDFNVCQKLSKSFLDQLISGRLGVSDIFLDTKVFGFMGSKSLDIVQDKKTPILSEKNIIRFLKNKDNNLKSMITLQNRGSNKEDKKTEKTLPVGWFLHSLPFEYQIEGQGNEKTFYRFSRGLWFFVDQARFEPIKKILRDFKIRPKDDLGLPNFCLDDTLGGKGDYKELRYNKRAVEELNPKELKAGGQQKAFLLDRLNVSLGQKTGHLFEFGDILLVKDGHYYIIHVKRGQASSLSHHREQVERSADFLGSNLDKHKNSFLFLRSAIDNLYHKNDLKINSKEKNYVHGDEFVKVKKRTIDRCLEQSENDYDKLKNFKTLVSTMVRNKKIDKPLFENHIKDFRLCLQALYDCYEKNASELSDENIQDFFERAEIALKGSDALFSWGILDEKNRQKITLVLLVIDDRGVEQYVKELLENNSEDCVTEERKKAFSKPLAGEKRMHAPCCENKTKPLFKNQDLWGLDRTRVQVLKHGFDFKIGVTNEGGDEDWDAFGKISSGPDWEEDAEEEGEEIEECFFPKKVHDSSKNTAHLVMNFLMEE